MKLPKSNKTVVATSTETVQGETSNSKIRRSIPLGNLYKSNSKDWINEQMNKPINEEDLRPNHAQDSKRSQSIPISNKRPIT